MSIANASRFLKLGLNLEYLRGVPCATVQTLKDLSPFPYLLENQPALRYSAKSVAAVIESLLGELKDAELPKTLAAVEDLRPMATEIEEFLQTSPAGGADGVTLQDHFAEKIVRTAEDAVKTLREEIA